MSCFYRYVLILTALTLLDGCLSLGKRDDAIDPVSQVVKRFSLSAASQSSISRSSGQITYLRLKTLFPAGLTIAAPGQPLAILDPQDFAFEGAQGVNGAFGAKTRPFDSLAQSALRNKVGALCKLVLEDSATTIFKLPPSALLSGESAPADATVALSIAALRNAWLHPYQPQDSEVQQLVSLYSQVKATPGAEGGVPGARRAVCMAVLLAPQFWMGNPTDDDPVRRVSLEVFRRIPPMQELKDFSDKKVTMSAYFDGLMANSTSKQGFADSLHQWHYEWLGLREFIDPKANLKDRRASEKEDVKGASLSQQLAFAPDESDPGHTLISIHQGGLGVSSRCVSTAVQDFDPDTKLTIWEHKNYDTGKFDFMGGYVRTGSIKLADKAHDISSMGNAELVTALSNSKIDHLGPFLAAGAAVATAVVKDLCDSHPELSVTDQAGVVWLRCEGLITLNAAAGEKAYAGLQGVLAQIDNNESARNIKDAKSPNIAPYCPPGQTGDQCVAYVSKLYSENRNLYIDDLRQLLSRLKQYTSAGPVFGSPRATVESIFAQANPSGASCGQTPDVYGAFMCQLPKVKEGINAFHTNLQAGNWYYQVHLADINSTAPVSGAGTYYTYNHQFSLGGFSMYVPSVTPTPINDSSKGGFLPSDRRVRRLGGLSGAWQDGYSPVKLWWTGGTVNVCNTADRLWATCFYRPKSNSVPGDVTSNFNASIGTFWNDLSTNWISETAMHPAVATAFYCGLPEAEALSAVPDAKDRNALYRATKFAPLNAVANNIDLWGDNTTAPLDSPTGAEIAVFKEVADQLREEPYRLIENVVLAQDDYRKILTANYTTGNSCLQMYYDTQGYYLPRRDNITTAQCEGPGDAPTDLITPGKPIPIGFLSNVDGGFAGETVGRQRMWSAIYGATRAPATSLPPRVYSGIVTMPAFLAPVATGARSIGSRFFSRLMCGEPNLYDPAADKAHGGATGLQAPFISQRRHLQQPCYQCHINLDPLVSAFSWSFQGLLKADPNDPGFKTNANGGEGDQYDYIGEIDFVSHNAPAANILGNMQGLRHGGSIPSDGAFMGQPVKGIADLAQKVANSDPFASCVTQTLFLNLYGRPVQFSDTQFVNSLVSDFSNPNKLNYRYIDLIKAMITSDSFQKKN